MRKAALLTGGILAVLLAGWLGIRPHPQTTAQDDSTRMQSKQQTGEDAGSTKDNPADSRKHARPRAALTPALKLMGDKVTVLEGTVGTHGSEGPVKLRRLDGTIIDAARIALHGDGTATLSSPVEIIMPEGGKLESRTGTFDMQKDGTFSITGELSFTPDSRDVRKIGE